MLNARVLSATTLGLALAAAVALPGAHARADERRPGLNEPAAAPQTRPTPGSGFGPLAEPVADGPFLGTGELDETAWDIPGQLVVDARDDLDEGGLLALARDFGLRFTPTALAAETKEEITEVPVGKMAEIMARLARDPRVELVEPLARVQMSYAPNDPLLKNQWHMERVGASRAWDFATGRGVTVAVIDTGIACENHGPFTKGTDLANTECVPGWNAITKSEHANDDQGHGTHVAGTIAQSTNNGIGGAGLAFNARLMPVKVLSESGSGTTADVADGIRWAAEHGAHVINLSLGGPRNSGVLQKAINFAVSRGVVVVAAAGNTGGRVGYPGASEGVIGVSASDPDDKIARFSSRGDGVDISAPGVSVTQQTICNRGRDKCENFASWNGTSMASPHVAGAAALVMSLGVTDPSAVEDALRRGARTIDDSDAGRKLYGAGILQAANSVERVTFQHALVRLAALLGLTILLAAAAKKKNAKAESPWQPAYWIPALAAGPGILFFLPWVLPRVNVFVDVISRPLADLDMLASLSMHRFLPLANAVIPFALTALAFGVKKLRPSIAGFSAGTAAYLTSVVVLADVAGPLGRVPLILWCAGNAVVCAWIARTNLAETN